MKLCCFEDCYKDRVHVHVLVFNLRRSSDDEFTLPRLAISTHPLPQIRQKRGSQVLFQSDGVGWLCLMCVRNRPEGASPGQQRRVTEMG